MTKAENRIILINLTNSLLNTNHVTREMVKCNDLIQEHYNKEANQILIFNSFIGWKLNGYKVKKGEKAFLFWGRPVNKRGKDAENNENKDDDEIDSHNYFPIAYLFSNLQVQI